LFGTVSIGDVLLCRASHKREHASGIRNRNARARASSTPGRLTSGPSSYIVCQRTCLHVSGAFQHDRALFRSFYSSAALPTLNKSCVDPPTFWSGREGLKLALNAARPRHSMSPSEPLSRHDNLLVHFSVLAFNQRHSLYFCLLFVGPSVQLVRRTGKEHSETHSLAGPGGIFSFTTSLARFTWTRNDGLILRILHRIRVEQLAGIPMRCVCRRYQANAVPELPKQTNLSCIGFVLFAGLRVAHAELAAKHLVALFFDWAPTTALASPRRTT